MRNVSVSAVCWFSVALATVHAAVPPAPATRQRVASALSGLPLAFETNRGQAAEKVQFVSRGPGYSLLLSPDAAVVLPRQKTGVGWSMNLMGANPAAKGRGIRPLAAQTYYFTGNDPAKWLGKVPNYEQVRFDKVYRGIDLLYYGNQGQMEYDFIVAPGADPAQIGMRFPEARTALIEPRSGDLIIKLDSGEIVLHHPVAYQKGIHPRAVASRFVMRGDRQVGIETGDYDKTQELVIDPVLTVNFMTYFGGTGNDAGYSLSLDAAGNVYITGTIESADFPVAHALGTAYTSVRGVADAFVSKLSFNSSTSQWSLVWSTYLGGTGYDGASAVTVDNAGNVYVTGYTHSPDFPLLHPLAAPYDVYRGDWDTFVTKLNYNSATSTLSIVYSGLIGGEFADIPRQIRVDGAGNAYVLGNAHSVGFPSVHPLPNTGLFGPYIAKLAFDTASATLSLVYCTHLTDVREDQANFMDLDPSGDLVITGVTGSPTFPLVHPLPAPNNVVIDGQDGYVMRVHYDPASMSLSRVWSTALGGHGSDFPLGVAVDPAGNVYVTGMTYSPDFPTVNGLPAPANALRGFIDAFVSKLTYNQATGALTLAYSTYLGGSDNDYGAAIAADAAGNAYVIGPGYSADFPVASPLAGTTCGAFGVGFLTKLSHAGGNTPVSLAASTCLGTGTDNFHSLALDGAGGVYLFGTTYAANVAVVNPLPPPNNVSRGGGETLLAKITIPDSVATFASATPKLVISGGGTRFELNEAVVLGAGSNGIRPVTEAVTLRIGSLTLTIPAGSFTALANGTYVYSGTVNGVTLSVQIAPTGTNSFNFKVEGSGTNFAGITNPVTVGLTIGDDSGTGSCTADIR